MPANAIGRLLANTDICIMTIAVVAATELELKPIKELISNSSPELKNKTVSFFCTGIGLMETTYNLTGIVYKQKPEIIVQTGIAGSFIDTLLLGDVVVIENEYYGDMGVVENNIFSDVFDMKLIDANKHPFENKALNNPWLHKLKLTDYPKENGVSVNNISTDKQQILQLRQKYNCAIENMEGAALHYVCLQTKTPFIQLRAVSNYVGERDKSKWDIQLALNNLANTTAKLIKALDVTG